MDYGIVIPLPPKREIGIKEQMVNGEKTYCQSCTMGSHCLCRKEMLAGVYAGLFENFFLQKGSLRYCRIYDRDFKLEDGQPIRYEQGRLDI